jgi:hypothetical protein
MNNCALGRRFGASDTNIERWRQQKKKMTNVNSTQTCSSGLKKGHLQEQEIIEYVYLKGETGVSFPCEMIKYKAQKLSKSHVMWHQFHATMGLHTYDVDEQDSSLSKNALLETATRFCGEVCSFSETSHLTSQNELLHSEQSKKS